ncbi:MAG TPA: Rieske 2Fe-2S domain-containing protein [Usitatibacter sp.]|nr:Rieske 2Fe-2S domain-containing protein [Usitatibacter sp.]
MLSPQENDLLCRVEGDAPMGQVFRRHWIPVCMSEEVAENDGTPVHARILGEDLVVFRDTEGRLGVLDEHCPHRRASLALGRNEEGGLRCLYHGWKVDVRGNVLEMASEPNSSGLCEKVKHLAYPVEEAGGFVWAWMGPKEEMTSFERPAFAPTPGTRVSIVKVHVDANWAQILEGAIDSAHSSSLHSTDMPPARVDGAKATGSVWPRPSTDKAPRLQLQQTPFGFRYAAIRRPIANSATHDYIRITLFVAPFTVLIPPNNLYNLSILHIPQDDTHTYFYFVAWSDVGDGIDQEAWRKFCGAQPGIDLDHRWRKRRSQDNFYLQDRQAMKLGDFTGIRGIPMQDMAMWETMGPIADRGRERLGASDLAIVEFRRIMVEAARAFAGGAPAIGAATGIERSKLRSFEGIVPKATDWRTLNAANPPEEPVRAAD